MDAVYKAIEKVTKIKTEVKDYSIKALSSGGDATGIVNISLLYKGKVYYGSSSSTDIIEASALAYLNAINRILLLKNTKKKRK